MDSRTFHLEIAHIGHISADGHILVADEDKRFFLWSVKVEEKDIGLLHAAFQYKLIFGNNCPGERILNIIGIAEGNFRAFW